MTFRFLLKSLKFATGTITKTSCGHQGPSNYWQLLCLSSSMCRLTTKEHKNPSALLALCEGSPLETGEFPSESVSNAESFSMSWDHHAISQCGPIIYWSDMEYFSNTWWCHQMEGFSMLLALCEGNPPVTGGFPIQRPVTWSFDVFFHLCLNKCLSKQSRHWLFETPSCSLWHHHNTHITLTDNNNALTSMISVTLPKNQREWET